MVVIEIPPNPNCVRVETRVFYAASSAQQVSQVRLARQAGAICWYDITGWTTAGTACPAMMQKVDDSGEGVALLIYGGDAGLRLKLAAHASPWRLDDPEQWGEPYLLLSDVSDVHLVQPSKLAVVRGEERE